MDNSKSLSAPRLATIREVARLGILPENALRRAVKTGKIPGFYSGRRFLVNLDRLLELINAADGDVRL